MTTPHAWDSLSELVLVAAHAVVRPSRLAVVVDDAAWFLHGYQTGEAACYVEHVRAGVQRAASTPDGLLVFSGGQTRAEAGPATESQGYWAVAEHFGWWSHREVRRRATTEEFARDSLENLLFGICRFRECTGRLPRRTTVVGWAFKSQRFELHRAAIGYPRERFAYVAQNDPAKLTLAIQGEHEQALGPYALDPMGMRPPLVSKRYQRNPFRRQHGYLQSCPELCELLTSDTPVPRDRLPWR